MSDAEPFDFRAPARLDEALSRRVTDLARVGASRSSLYLESMLRRPTTMDVGPIERFEPQPGTTTFPVLATGEDAPVGALDMSNGLATALAEVVMGGAGAGDPGDAADGRPPSPLERLLLAEQLTPALGPLAAALAPLGVHRLVLSPHAPPSQSSDQLAAIPITLTIGPLTGVVRVALPMRLIGRPEDGDEQPRRADPAVAHALENVPLEVTVRFRGVRVPATELDALEVGDVIVLDHDAHEPLLASVGPRPWFLGALGRSGDRVALSVTEILDSADEPPTGDVSPPPGGAAPQPPPEAGAADE